MLSLALLAAVALPVPFVAQQKDTCGAAALAMVLQYHGQAAAQEEIAATLVEPELQGIRGSRLAAFARERGLVALVFAGDLALAREHVGKGRPLVLALSAGRGRYHDVVLVGFDDEASTAVVHDPAVGPRRSVSVRELQKRWGEAGFWTLLVQPAGSPTPAVSEPASVTPPPAASEPASVTPPPAGPVSAATPVDPGSYEGLLERAIALARQEPHQAAALLDRAAVLDPTRPEAWVERGGLAFLDSRYDDAIGDLRRALSLREDAYARDLLASSLQLAGRVNEALAAWNPLGKPTLAAVEIGGLSATRDEVARREIALSPGDLITPRALRAAKQRLTEVGAFDRVTVRPRLRGDGTADLDVALAERHGLARGPVDLIVTTAVNLPARRARLRYSNLAGSGVALGASYRWQENRPETALQLQWPRPLGVPGSLRLTGFRGEQAYDPSLDPASGTDQPLRMRRRGADLSFRHVLDGAATVSFGLRLRDRTFSRRAVGALPGLLVGLEAGVESALIDTRRQRLDATARVFASGPALGSDVTFGQVDGQLRYEAVVSQPEGRSVERSVFAARLRGGWASGGVPVDEMYAPGVSPESDLPLRAHRLTRNGVIGANPVARSIGLLNIEWRQRLLYRPAFSLAAAAFTDVAALFDSLGGGKRRALVDSGAGLRLSILGGPVVRVDYAWGLNEKRRALFLGLSQAF